MVLRLLIRDGRRLDDPVARDPLVHPSVKVEEVHVVVPLHRRVVVVRIAVSPLDDFGEARRLLRAPRYSQVCALSVRVLVDVRLRLLGGRGSGGCIGVGSGGGVLGGAGFRTHRRVDSARLSGRLFGGRILGGGGSGRGGSGRRGRRLPPVVRLAALLPLLRHLPPPASAAPGGSPAAVMLERKTNLKSLFGDPSRPLGRGNRAALAQQSPSHSCSGLTIHRAHGSARPRSGRHPTLALHDTTALALKRRRTKDRGSRLLASRVTPATTHKAKQAQN